MSKDQMRLMRADFPSRGQSTHRAHGKYFSLSVSPLPAGHQRPRFACVVSKRTAAGAVIRNRIKRRCREVARTLLGEVDTPLALVFYAKKGVDDASIADIRDDARSLVEKLLRVGYNAVS